MGLKSFLFGGGPKPYTSKYNGIYEDEYSDALHNRMGAKFAGYDEKGRQRYDYSQVGQPVSMASATSEYDFSPMDQAIAGMRTRATNPNKYQTSTFNFADPSMIDAMTANEYAMGSSDINRQAQGNLEKLRETVGTRRPGLLLKAGENNQRSTAENLARLQQSLRGTAMGQKLALNKEQQLAQAGENLAGFNANEANTAAALEALNQAGQGKIATQSGLQELKQNQQDRAMEYMLDMIKTYLGQSNQAAAAGNQKSGNIGSIISAGAKIASMI